MNGAFVPDGTLIRALIDGQVFAEGLTQTFQGVSAYTLDIPGEDADTTALDGGRAGDTVQFEIGGALAEQTGIWGSGTNVRLDLTATTTEPLSEPQPTPLPLPTQTAIPPLASLSPTLVPPTEDSSPTPDAFTGSLATSTNSSSYLSAPPASGKNPEIVTPIVHSSLEPVQSLNPEVGSSRSNSALTIAILIGAVVIGGALWIVRNRKSSNLK